MWKQSVNINGYLVQLLYVYFSMCFSSCKNTRLDLMFHEELSLGLKVLT